MQDNNIQLTPENVRELREASKERLLLSEALKRLYNNKDFQDVILTDYMEREPARLVHLLGEPNFVQHREDLRERMMGIAKFGQHLRLIHQMAQQAQKTIDDLAEAERASNG